MWEFEQKLTHAHTDSNRYVQIYPATLETDKNDRKSRTIFHPKDGESTTVFHQSKKYKGEILTFVGHKNLSLKICLLYCQLKEQGDSHRVMQTHANSCRASKFHCIDTNTHTGLCKLTQTGIDLSKLTA